MLPKSLRLPYLRQTVVRRSGRRIQAPVFELAFIPTVTNSRWTFFIPKKVVNLASKRNRIKRLLSAAVFSIIPDLKIHTDTIIRVKKDISETSLEETKKIVAALLQTANIL